jgi:mRNA-degrading endonuclease YafQ of YafQ-DinJ toxin-antitoxin module
MPKGKGNPHEKGKRKKNICVCCGVEKDLTRHHIVPLQYRKLFSLENKDHRHNDIVALCQSCHHAYEKTANEIRLRLEKDFEDIVNKNALISQKKKAISALKRELPLERREFFLRKEEELKDLPENPIDIDTLVIQKYGEKTLSRIWRNHFSEWLYKQRTK